jgi:hypothetical protein
MYLNRAIPTAGQITLALMTPNGLVPKCLHTPRHNVRETIIKPRMNRIYHHCICACNCTNLLAHLHTGPRGATHVQDDKPRIQMEVSWCVRARTRERARARICECVHSDEDMNTITDEYNNR